MNENKNSEVFFQFSHADKHESTDFSSPMAIQLDEISLSSWISTSSFFKLMIRVWLTGKWFNYSRALNAERLKGFIFSGGEKNFPVNWDGETCWDFFQPFFSIEQ